MREPLQTRIFSTIMRSTPHSITAQHIRKALGGNDAMADIQNGLVQLYARQVIDKEPFKQATPTKWFITKPKKNEEVEPDYSIGVPF